nr:myb family transcription factor EFM-like [Ipomoea batatas]GMD00994.1 myb family transcription factor EFM-like [Ipomoea batatas]
MGVEEFLRLKGSSDNDRGTKRVVWMRASNYLYIQDHDGGGGGGAKSRCFTRTLSLSPPSLPQSAVVYKSSCHSHSSKTMNKQEQRKSRRCWSPKLHQLFVDALDKLGGAQGL